MHVHSVSLFYFNIDSAAITSYSFIQHQKLGQNNEWRINDLIPKSFNVSLAKNQVKNPSGHDKWMAGAAAVQPKSRFL